MKAIPTKNQQNSVATIGFVRRGYSTTGGAEAYLKRLAAGILARGYRVVLLGSGEWPTEAWPGGEVVAFPHHSLRSFAKEVLEYKKAGKIDLLFSLERVPGCDIFRAGDGVHAAWLERRKIREPAWKRLLSSLMPRHRELLALERELFSPSSSTLVIANSAMVAREIQERFSFPGSHVEIIPNGVPPVALWSPAERHAAREALRIEEGTFVLLFVGSGWKRKGVAIAIQAVDRLHQQDPNSNVRLWVAGKGPSRNYKSKAVRFLGPVQKMELLYSAADLFILPTLYDPFANASLEALAAGLPVITTAANGCAEVIEEGVHGSVIQDSNDVEAFASAISFWQERLQSAEGPVIRAVCRERGSTFDMEKNLERTIEVMESRFAAVSH
ncbi:MAG: glycosyltransferase family 4 protein [Chthoniobacterales bacterium]